jgi:hypothetical protein
MSMAWTGTAADFATMATGLSVLTATYVWVRRQQEERRERRTARRNRNWHAYVMPEGINDWFVRVVEDEPQSLTAQVVLEVVDRDGDPDPAMAHAMRQVANGDGRLARAPTEDEWASGYLKGTGLPNFISETRADAWRHSMCGTSASLAVRRTLEILFSVDRGPVVLARQVHIRHPVWVRMRNGPRSAGRRLATALAAAAGSG